MKRTRRDWGMICLGLAMGFMLGEVKVFFHPDQVAAWVPGLLTLAFLMLGFCPMRRRG